MLQTNSFKTNYFLFFFSDLHVLSFYKVSTYSHKSFAKVTIICHETTNER